MHSCLIGENLPFDINWWSNMPFVRSFCGPDFDFKIDEWSTEPFVRSFITWHWHTAQRWKLTFHALFVLFLKLYFWRASPTSGVIFYVQEASIFWLHLFFLLQTLSFVQNSTLWKSGCIFSLDASRPSMAKNDSHLSQFIFRKRKKYFTLFFRGRAKNDDSVFLLPAKIGLFFGNI